ncbi:hypothetical protein ACGFJC_53405 [Nonomuraea fuscirosea]|uniref:hypothetical protein n=1 Tax=Nonomuraea fuscirosea TaxID=1291556 RepID=UPI003494DE64
MQVEWEKKFWLGDDEIERLGYEFMYNGRPTPKRVDEEVIDFWDASWAAQLDFMEKYDPSLSDKSLEIMWAVTAAYHNQYPTHPDGCYITCAEGPPVKEPRSAAQRAAEEFARHWAKVKGPEWTNADGAKYAYYVWTKQKDRALKMVTKFKEKWIAAYKDVISAAATFWSVPDWVLAGIAYQEVGGSPPLDRAAFVARLSSGQIEKARLTSFGPLSIQYRLALDLLGYKSVNETLAWEIIDLVENPAGNLFLAAKYLSNLHAKEGGAWTDVEVRRVATAYNGSGSDAQRYGSRFMNSVPIVKHLMYGSTVSV